MYQRLKTSFYVQLWFIPLFALYVCRYLNGNIDSTVYLFIDLLLSSVVLIFSAAISSFFYNEILDDVVSEIPPSIRIQSTGLKVHIVTLVLLAIIYFSFSR